MTHFYLYLFRRLCFSCVFFAYFSVDSSARRIPLYAMHVLHTISPTQYAQYHSMAIQTFHIHGDYHAQRKCEKLMNLFSINLLRARNKSSSYRITIFSAFIRLEWIVNCNSNMNVSYPTEKTNAVQQQKILSQHIKYCAYIIIICICG